MAIDWRAGYSTSWRVFRVNPSTWADAEVLPGVTQFSVERGRDGVGDALESGSMSVDVAPGTEFVPGYYRVVMVAHQAGETERVELATMWCESASGRVDRNVDDLSVKCLSVLHPADTRHLEQGSYARVGDDGAELAAEMLRGCVNAPVTVDGSFTLDQSYVFDPGQAVLLACWTLLDAGGYTITISGSGEIGIGPKPTDPSLLLDWANARLLHPGIDHSLDYTQVHNKYVAVSGTQRAEATNDDPTSPTSTVTRGFVSDVYDTNPIRVDGETLTAYCERKLEEDSTVDDARTYEREWWPDVYIGDLVRGSIPSVGLEGDLRVKQQSLQCGRGVVVTETSAREVRLWQR